MSVERKLSVFLLVLGLALGSLTSRVFAADTDPVAEVTQAPEAQSQASYPEGSSTRVRTFTSRQGRNYLIPDEPFNEELRALYGELSPADQAKFDERRVAFLERVLGFLEATRSIVGSGIYVKDKITRLAFWKEHETPDPLRKQTRETIQAALFKLNERLYGSAKVVAEANEFSVNLGGILGGGGGWGERGWFGSLGVGLSLGYNHDLKTLAFDAYVETERFSRTMGGLGTAYLSTVVGVNAVARDTREGYGFRGRERSYIVGGGLVDTSPRLLGAGYLVGFPPLGIGLTVIPNVSYTVKNSQLPLFGLTVSPLQKGWVRPYGAVVDLGQHALNGVAAFSREVAGRVTGAARAVAAGCGALWNYLRGGAKG